MDQLLDRKNRVKLVKCLDKSLEGQAKRLERLGKTLEH